MLTFILGILALLILAVIVTALPFLLVAVVLAYVAGSMLMCLFTPPARPKQNEADNPPW